MKHHHPPIRFVYFDIGGVLLKWRERIDVIAIKHGKSKVEVEEAFARYDTLAARGSIDPQVMWEMVREDLHIQFTDYVDWYMILDETFHPIRETHRFIKSLIKKVPVGILSNLEKGSLDVCMRNGSMPKIPYTTIVQSCEVGMIKPEPGIYKYAEKQVGISGEHILFIDDVQENLDGAKALGWQTFLFDTDRPHASVGNLQSLLAM